MQRQQQLLFLELNEVNFEFIDHYVRQGELPRFAQLIARHGYGTTSSETEHDHLEPWIQWVTAHTGLSFAEHGVFRLGDIVDHDIPQIWERLEEQGLKVGAVSPMNAKFRLKDPAFFVPDPWTGTEAHVDQIDRRFFAAISRAVNENATGRMGAASARDLIVGAARNASVANYPTYLRMLVSARRKHWYRALFLDQLLSDMFVRLVKRRKPHYATLFLNAAAHIQHHYMFNSKAAASEQKNPSWYIAPDEDPVLDVYRLYDRIIGQVMTSFPDARIMLATGLHQVPHDRSTFYWRLKDHASFLRRLGIEFEKVDPRMSRDFLVTCLDAAAAERAQQQLEQVRADDGEQLFTVDNRGRDLFVMLSYSQEITAATAATAGDSRVDRLHDHVSFVAIKNGEHDGTGYFLDSGAPRQERSPAFPLAELPDRVVEAMVPG